jgi:hypothetical protein
MNEVDHRERLEKCGRETNHAQVGKTGFCRCTHVMFPMDEKEIELCPETRGGGGRICSLEKGHKGGHIYEC